MTSVSDDVSLMMTDNHSVITGVATPFNDHDVTVIRLRPAC